MTTELDHLKQTFLDALPDYVQVVGARLAPDLDLTEAIESAGSWLSDELTALGEIPFAQQRRGPLELFQEAMRFPIDALAAAGVPKPVRDEVEAAALPGDTYGLAPPTSRDLGEEAWMAHLAWGAAKARAMKAPKRIGVLSRNLMDRSKLDAAIGRSGAEAVAVRGELPSDLMLVLVDLDHPDAMDTIEAASSAGTRAIGYGPHADVDKLAAAEAAGAEALPRSAVLRDPEGFVGRL